MARELGTLARAAPVRGDGGGQALGSLKTVPPPSPSGLATFVQDTNALIRLGKALFWDTQLGGDGQVACGQPQKIGG
jgi:hypothetical protein